MTRTLTTAVKNQLATRIIRPIHLISIGFATPVYLTDSSYELTSSISGTSRTYTASDFLMGFSEISELTDITKASLKLTLSGANLTYISIILNENITNIPVTIYRGLLDSSNAVIADPFLLYSGVVDRYSIGESTKSSSVQLSVASHWADFDKKNGRKTNLTSTQRFFSTDVGMEFASELVNEIKWGRE